MAKCPHCDEDHPDVLDLLRGVQGKAVEFIESVGLEVDVAQIAKADADAARLGEQFTTYEVDLPLSHKQIAAAALVNLALSSAAIESLQTHDPTVLIDTLTTIQHFLVGQLKNADDRARLAEQET